MQLAEMRAELERLCAVIAADPWRPAAEFAPLERRILWLKAEISRAEGRPTNDW